MSHYDDTDPQTADAADESPSSSAARTTTRAMTTTNNPLLHPSTPLVSDLEQEVLDEYARLLDNVNKLAATLDTLSADPCSVTLDGLRLLERKTATVCTLLKASVYSIVLQQQIYNDDHQDHEGRGGSGGGGGQVEEQYQQDLGGDGYEVGDGTTAFH
ncbi:hypothetical protein VTN02DRAFT_6869 [Thermoascus thermophilus]